MDQFHPLVTDIWASILRVGGSILGKNRDYIFTSYGKRPSLSSPPIWILNVVANYQYSTLSAMVKYTEIKIIYSHIVMDINGDFDGNHGYIFPIHEKHPSES